MKIGDTMYRVEWPGQTPILRYGKVTHLCESNGRFRIDGKPADKYGDHGNIWTHRRDCAIWNAAYAIIAVIRHGDLHRPHVERWHYYLERLAKLRRLERKLISHGLL